MKKKILLLHKHTQQFAENKDIARELRTTIILPAIESGGRVELDFTKIDAVTQSFIHALISDVIRQHGSEVLDRVAFKNCNLKIQKIIQIVTDYMQD
jgi:hypothetical protein